MKKLIISILAVFMLAVVSAQARTFALVVGISRYQVEDANLSQTAKDAKSMKALIEKAITKDVTILTSKYATKDNIIEKMRAICNRAQKGDNILFYYSGHGADGGLYVYDNKLLQYDEIADLLDSSDATFKICYIDACHAGSSATATSAGPTKKNDCVYVVGCRPEESSLENAVLGAGFFTRSLLLGLRGKADSNADKKVTVIELFKFVYNDVVRRSKGQQHPQLIAPERLHQAVLCNWNKKN